MFINQIPYKLKTTIQTPNEHRNQTIIDEISEITKLYDITMEELVDLIYNRNSSNN